MAESRICRGNDAPDHRAGVALAARNRRSAGARRAPGAEWKAGHLENAQLCPLDRLGAQLPWLEDEPARGRALQSGYRSMVACSLLRKAGYRGIMNVIGAMMPGKTPGIQRLPAAPPPDPVRESLGPVS